MVIDTDGSAFITKAEFDSLKNIFQSQIDNYNSSIDSKIDGAIASYLSGIKMSSIEVIDPVVPIGEMIISTSGNDYGWAEGVMEFDWTTITGPFGDYGASNMYCVLTEINIRNSRPYAPFREVQVEYDKTTKSGVYIQTVQNRQSCVATSIHWCDAGYSNTKTDMGKVLEFFGWHRINPDAQKTINENFCNLARGTSGSSAMIAFSGNRSVSLTNGTVYAGTNIASKGTCNMSREAKSSQYLRIVCPNSIKPVWGFFDPSRTLGFCNDSSDGTLDDFSKVVGQHTMLTGIASQFTCETKMQMWKTRETANWTIVTSDPGAQMEFNAEHGVNGVYDWYYSIPYVQASLGSYAESHNSNFGYYHRPYIGCETISNWNKIGIDYNKDINTRILESNNHGTLVSVNGSQYLSPVSGIPIFTASSDGIAELKIKIQKDTDHMPDINSAYADLYLSTQPFKENDLGYNNAVIGSKSGSTSRKLISDQPTGSGSGSVKVDYDADTTLKFEVQKNETIFINFSAYEPSQSNYRGKCTATIQDKIKLTKNT